MSKSLVPLSELPSMYDDYTVDATPRITWDIALPPHVDTERIVFDAGHMGRLQKIGAFSMNHFVSYQGEATEYEPTIVGMNENGTAIAGQKAVKAKSVESSRQDIKSDGPKDVNTSNYFTFSATHRINRTELSQTVSDRLATRERDQNDVWAKQLDDVLQASIRRSAREALLQQSPLGLKLIDGAITAWVSEVVIDDVMKNNIAGAVTWVGAFAANRAIHVFGDGSRNARNTGSDHLHERRWSVFENMQPDRYLALDGLTRINSLIKYKNNR